MVGPRSEVHGPLTSQDIRIEYGRYLQGFVREDAGPGNILNSYFMSASVNYLEVNFASLVINTYLSFTKYLPSALTTTSL